MKRLIYLLAFSTLIFSCKSIEKMVDKGEYDEAIFFATDKLYGKKNKKTKYVKGLEKAFNELHANDLYYIESLQTSANPSRWANVYSTLTNMQLRQNKVATLTPLVSKNGYVAHFDFVDLNPLISKAAKGASEYQYIKGSEHLDNEDGSKVNARIAFEELSKIERYFDDYKDTDRLLKNAHELGTTHVLVSFENTRPELSIASLNDFWHQYYITEPGHVALDYKTTLIVDYVDIGADRERENSFVETKEIKDGFEYVLDDNGNVQKDTLGNDIKVDKYVDIQAWVTEIFREKTALAHGSIQLVNLRKQSIENELPVSSEVLFEDSACTFRGDRRALPDRIFKRTRDRIADFPSDGALAWDAELRLQESYLDYLKELDLL